MVWDWVPLRAAFFADLALASWGLAEAAKGQSSSIEPDATSNTGSGNDFLLLSMSSKCSTLS